MDLESEGIKPVEFEVYFVRRSHRIRLQISGVLIHEAAPSESHQSVFLSYKADISYDQFIKP